MKGISVHIGVNQLDFLRAYDIRNLDRLYSCLNDAEAISKMMGGEFEDPVILNNAKKQEVVDAIKKAQVELGDNDICVITYSGHGTQIPDDNSDEFDSEFDSVWCLSDGFLLDDTITDLVTGFDTGVRVVVVSDSCHSGTIVDFDRIGYTKDFIELAQFNGVDFKNLERKILSAKGWNFVNSGIDDWKFSKDLEFLKRPEIEKLREKNLEIKRRDLFAERLNDHLVSLARDKRKTVRKSSLFDFVYGNNQLTYSVFNQTAFPARLNTQILDSNYSDILEDLSRFPLIGNVKTLPRDLVAHVAKEKEEEIKSDRDAARTSLSAKVENSGFRTVKELKHSKQIILISACKDDEVTKGGCSENDNSYFVKAVLEILKTVPTGKGYKYLHSELSQKLKSYLVVECGAIAKAFTHEQTPQFYASKSASRDFVETTKPFAI